MNGYQCLGISLLIFYVFANSELEDHRPTKEMIALESLVNEQSNQNQANSQSDCQTIVQLWNELGEITTIMFSNLKHLDYCDFKDNVNLCMSEMTDAFQCGDLPACPTIDSDCQILHNSWNELGGVADDAPPLSGCCGIPGSGIYCTFDYPYQGFYLDWRSRNLSGTIPSYLGDLSNLTYLYDISFTNCFVIRYLFDNQLTGTIPDSLGKLYTLNGLFLSDNQLNGSIPSTLDDLPELHWLKLNGNSLEGSFPNPQISPGFDSLYVCNLNDNPLLCLDSDNILPTVCGDLPSCDKNLTTDSQPFPSDPSLNQTITEVDTISVPTPINDSIEPTIPPDAQCQLLSALWSELGGSYNPNLTPDNCCETGNNGIYCNGKHTSEGYYIEWRNSNFTNAIPETIGQLSNISYIYFSDNSLTGTIPESIGNLTTLEGIFLSNNQLNGTLPRSLQYLNNLKWLFLDSNQFSGNIPAYFKDLKVQFLYLNNNQFHGPFPNPNTQPGYEDLYTCRIADNPLLCLDNENTLPLACDTLPPCPTRTVTEPITSLITIPPTATFTSRSPQATIKSAYCRILFNGWYTLGGQSALKLKNGSCCGEVSNGIYCNNENQIEDGFYVDWRNLSLNGTIPDEFGSLLPLAYLYLFGNNLTGRIPESFGNLINLNGLFLSNNHLVGTIPESIGNLPSLNWLYLDGNELTGSIPSQLGFNNLNFLKLNDNRLSGSFPNLIQNSGFVSLYVCNIQNNDELCIDSKNILPSICGSLPNCSVNTNTIETAPIISTTAGSNDTTLQIDSTKTVSNSQNTPFANLKDCRIAKRIWELMGGGPDVQIPKDNCCGKNGILCESGSITTIQLDQNQLTGSIKFLEGMYQLEKAFLSYNQFNGNIPLLNSTQLTTLILDSNNLNGPIPNLSQLTNLQYLSISQNQLTGVIPHSIGLLNQLMLLDVSSNELLGEVPNFKNLTQLRWLYLKDNLFYGNLPVSKALNTELNACHIKSGNQFCFSNVNDIPESCGKAQEFQNCDCIVVKNAWESMNGNTNRSPDRNQCCQKPSGIQCREEKIISINWAHSDLFGDIYTEFNQLQSLETLILNSNELEHPNNLNLKDINVKHLDLGNNRLNGLIHPWICESKDLEELNLSYNSFYGELCDFSNLTNLKFLSFAGNKLEGHIPSLNNLKQLKSIKNKEKEEPIPIYERFNQRERLAILLLLRRIAIIVPEIRKLGSLHGDYPRIQDEQRQSKWKIQASPKKCTILPGSFKRYDSVIQFLSKKCPGEWPPMATDTLTLVNGEWIIADGADTDHVVLFLHGGAYWTGDIMILAPQHPYPCALIDAVSAYLYLLESYPPAKIVIMGDSAGGGLSIATIMVLRDMQLPLPAGGFCLSPWVDLTLSCDSMQTNKHTDFLNDLNIHDKRLINRIHYYTADEYLKEDYISPFWSTDFGGLPPLLLQAGGAERLLDEIVSISVAAAKHNKSITLESHVHVFHMTFPFQKGAQIALTRAGEWIKSVTNRTSELSEISQRIELSFLGIEKKTSLLWKTPSVKQLFG
ncbi:hypothetical protein HDV02_002775 [Globomyces sp. JEL0801]|nr:hypothetical protein HDV02_002775 [Globomyces sp. JEL0801]